MKNNKLNILRNAAFAAAGISVLVACGSPTGTTEQKEEPKPPVKPVEPPVKPVDPTIPEPPVVIPEPSKISVNFDGNYLRLNPSPGFGMLIINSARPNSHVSTSPNLGDAYDGLTKQTQMIIADTTLPNSIKEIENLINSKFNDLHADITERSARPLYDQLADKLTGNDGINKELLDAYRKYKYISNLNSDNDLNNKKARATEMYEYVKKSNVLGDTPLPAPAQGEGAPFNIAIDRLLNALEDRLVREIANKHPLDKAADGNVHQGINNIVYQLGSFETFGAFIEDIKLTDNSLLAYLSRSVAPTTATTNGFDRDVIEPIPAPAKSAKSSKSNKISETLMTM